MRRPVLMDLVYIALLAGGFFAGAFFGGIVRRLFGNLWRSLLRFRLHRSSLLALLGIALLAGSFFAGAFFGDKVVSKLESKPGRTNSSELASSDDVSALGKLMPSGGIVSVVGPPGDRIEKIYVKNGETVEAGKAGKALVLLASHKDRRKEAASIAIQVVEAKRQKQAITVAGDAKLAEIDEQVEALDVTLKTEAKAQGLKITFLKQQLDAAEKQQDRIVGLDKTKVDVGDQERDRATLAVEQAKTELKAAQDALEASKKKNDLQIRAAKAQRVSVAADMELSLLRVPLESLEKNLELAKLRERRSTLTAPVAGTVVQIVGNDGDPTGTGPILYLAAGTGMVVIAEVYATDIRKLRAVKDLDKIEVEVTGPALGDKKLHGRIEALGLSVARNSVVGFNPRSDSDRRVIEVRVALDEKGAKIAAEFVGLEVDVKFIIPK